MTQQDELQQYLFEKLLMVSDLPNFSQEQTPNYGPHLNSWLRSHQEMVQRFLTWYCKVHRERAALGLQHMDFQVRKLIIQF